MNENILLPQNTRQTNKIIGKTAKGSLMKQSLAFYEDYLKNNDYQKRYLEIDQKKTCKYKSKLMTVIIDILFYLCDRFFCTLLSLLCELITVTEINL